MHNILQRARWALLIVIGVLSGIYAIIGGGYLVQAIVTQGIQTQAAIVQAVAYVVPPCVGLVVSVSCFQKAFQKPRLATGTGSDH